MSFERSRMTKNADEEGEEGTRQTPYLGVGGETTKANVVAAVVGEGGEREAMAIEEAEDRTTTTIIREGGTRTTITTTTTKMVGVTITTITTTGVTTRQDNSTTVTIPGRDYEMQRSRQ